MGTETYSSKSVDCTHSDLSVKLNNPLMGTETFTLLSYSNPVLNSVKVKLNNPLMGTETWLKFLLPFSFKL